MIKLDRCQQIDQMPHELRRRLGNNLMGKFKPRNLKIVDNRSPDQRGLARKVTFDQAKYRKHLPEPQPPMYKKISK